MRMFIQICMIITSLTIFIVYSLQYSKYNNTTKLLKGLSITVDQHDQVDRAGALLSRDKNLNFKVKPKQLDIV